MRLRLSGTANPSGYGVLKLTGSSAGRKMLLRAPLPAWVFPVNWRESVVVTREYRTEIFTSRSRKEQRRALRQTPRRTLEFTITVARGDLREFHRFLAGRQVSEIVMPDFTRRTHLLGPVTSAAPSAAVEEVPAWLTEGARVGFDNDGVIEWASVLSVAAGVVTFADLPPHVPTWPEGTTLHPAWTGHLENPVANSRLANAVGEAKIVFSVSKGGNLEIVPAAAPDTFDGRDLFLRRPNWAEPVDHEFDQETEFVDYGFGRPARFNPAAFGARTLQATFVGKDPEEVAEIEGFFDRAKGRRGEFYMPTGENDLPLAGAAAAGANTFLVEGREIGADYRSDTVFKALSILKRDGQVANRIVRTMRGVGSNTEVEIVGTLPFSMAPADVLRISWLPLWRFSTDTLTTEWLSARVAQIQMTMQTLEAADAE